MTTRRRLVLGIIVVAAVIVGIGWFMFHPLQREDPGQLTLYGNVDIREIQPAFNDSGAITKMLVVEGASVKKGDLLATLDDTRYSARKAQATRQAENLKATLDRLLHGSRPEEISQTKALMEGLQVIYENNKTLEARTSQLLPHGAASTEERDNATAQRKASEANFEAARQNYLLARKGPRVEDIDAARAAYQAAMAAADEANREWIDTHLYAPENGVIEDRILEPGDMASPATPVYTLALTQPLWVRAYVSESQLGKLVLGQSAMVTTDSFPGHHYQGWVGYVSPTAEFTPQTVETTELRTRLVYLVRVYVCNPQNELRLGMPATVKVDINHAGLGKSVVPQCSSAADDSHP